VSVAALDRTLAALADPARRRVVDLLAMGPRAAGDLAREVGVSAPTMSRHLKALKASGLVEDSHPDFDARVRVYALRPEPMVQVLRWLEESERLWSTQLMAFKVHLEGER
jgi:DNA-binding transcriptional ArsR family regulator